MSRTDPLAGSRIAITRSREQNAELRALLVARGADVVSVPTVRFVPQPLSEELAEVLAHPNEFTHVAFTSRNGVVYFGRLLDAAGVDVRDWAGCTFAAVGPSTAAACVDHGWKPAIVSEGGGEALAQELLDAGLSSTGRVLLPQSRIARSELESTLAAGGIAVRSVTVYDTREETPECAARLLTLLAEGNPPEGVVFASPSAVRAWMSLTGTAGRELLLRSETLVVSIGGTTTAALAERGITDAIEAERPSVDGLIAALSLGIRAQTKNERFTSKDTKGGDRTDGRS